MDNMTRQDVCASAKTENETQAGKDDLWLEALTEDVPAEAEPAMAGVQIECREGCGW